MRPGRVLAIDVGKVRIGLALSDPDRILASPLAAIHRDDESVFKIAELITEESAVEVVVGLPVNLRGTETESTQDARLFSSELAAKLSIVPKLVDERLSTVAAANKLRAAGRNARNSKSLIDSAAACEILETYLESWRRDQLRSSNGVE